MKTWLRNMHYEIMRTKTGKESRRETFAIAKPSYPDIEEYRIRQTSQSFQSKINFFVLSCVSLSLFLSCGAHSPRILDEKYRTIHISVLKNETFQFALEERLTNTMIEVFRRDGRLRVSPKNRADVELTGTITVGEVFPLAYSDLDRAVGFNLVVTLNVDVMDTASGAKLVENKEFTTRGVYLLSTEPTQSQSNEVSLKLADAVMSYLLEGW